MPSQRIDDIDEEIRALLRRKAERAQVAEPHLRRTLRRSDRQLARNVVALLLAAALATFGVVAAVRSLEGAGGERPANRPRPPRPVNPTPSSLEAATTWIHVPGELRNLPLDVAGTEEAIWIATGGNITFPPPGMDSDPGAQVGKLSRVNPTTGEITGTVDVGAAGDARVVAAFGDAWVLRPGFDQVIRFDGASLDQVATIPLTDPVAGVSDGSSLWVVSGGTGTVSRIDPTTNTVEDTIDTGIDAEDPPVDENGYFIPPYNGTPVVGIAASEGIVWVHGRSQLVRIDAGSGTVTASLDAGGRIEGLVAGDAGVWVSICTPVAPPCSWEIADVDPSTNMISDVLPRDQWGIPGSVERVGLALESGVVWAAVANYDADFARGTILEIDPATPEVIGTLPVQGGDSPSDTQKEADVYGPPVIQGGAIWVINVQNDEVVRLQLEH